MKYLLYINENGDATTNASTSGMCNVISSQPGQLPGKTGTSGSGDISFVMKRKKRKKGNASEVSDLRDLKPVKIKKVNEI